MTSERAAAVPSPRAAVVEMRGISICFPGVKALDGVDFTLYPGEVHSLMGENGAGKSTLIKALTGVYGIDGGTIRVDGEQRLFRVTPGTVDYGPTSIATNFNFAARAARYNVDAISSPQSDVAPVRAAIDGLLKQRVDAIVLVVVDTEVLAAVQALDIDVPIVAAATSARPHPRLVAIDQYRGARSAVRHLLEAGYDTVRHIAGPARNPDAVERIRGWRDEIATARAQSTPAVHGDWSAASGYRIASEADLSPGEGIFVANDHMAIGVLSALRERGLRVPEDIGVVGFDDVPEAAYVYPSLTTVRQDFAALGEILMQKVLLLVEEPDTVTESTPLPTRLIVRTSAPLAR